MPPYEPEGRTLKDEKNAPMCPKRDRRVKNSRISLNLDISKEFEVFKGKIEDRS